MGLYLPMGTAAPHFAARVNSAVAP
jgi:hypothetical protein